MLHEEFAPASRPRTESLFPFATPRDRPQSVSQSLSPPCPVSPFISRSSVHVLARILPRPVPLSWRAPSSFSFGDINPPPVARLALLFPALALTRELLSLLQPSVAVVVFWLTPYYSFSIARSVFRARGYDRAFPTSVFLSLFCREYLSIFFSLLSFPLSRAPPFIHLPTSHRNRAQHLRHISNLTRILSAAVSQTLKSFLGNWIECYPHPVSVSSTATTLVLQRALGLFHCSRALRRYFRKKRVILSPVISLRRPLSLFLSLCFTIALVSFVIALSRRPSSSSSLLSSLKSPRNWLSRR